MPAAAATVNDDDDDRDGERLYTTHNQPIQAKPPIHTHTHIAQDADTRVNPVPHAKAQGAANL
jgi:hypothetical protein